MRWVCILGIKTGVFVLICGEISFVGLHGGLQFNFKDDGEVMNPVLKKFTVRNLYLLLAYR